MHYLRELLYNRSVINNIHTDKYICIFICMYIIYNTDKYICIY